MIPLAPDARAALEASTQLLIAERDALYDCVSDGQGTIHNLDDRRDLVRLDRVIDGNRAVLASSRDDPVRDLLDAVKQLCAYQLRDPDPVRWYELQAAIARVDQLYQQRRAS